MDVSHKCVAQEIAEFQHLKLNIFQGNIPLAAWRKTSSCFPPQGEKPHQTPQGPYSTDHAHTPISVSTN